MRLSPADSASVDIKLVDRAGSIRVAVRTPDSGLAQDLQTGLSDLVHRLEKKGFEAETWTPGDGPGIASSQSAQPNGDGSASQHGSRDPRDASQQGGSGQQQNGRNRPRWVNEFEQGLAKGESD